MFVGAVFVGDLVVIKVYEDSPPQQVYKVCDLVVALLGVLSTHILKHLHALALLYDTYDKNVYDTS